MTHRPAARSRLRARVPALLLAGAFAALAHADDRPGPEGFFQHPRMTGASISPDGQTVAMAIAPQKGAQVGLVALDLKTMKLTALATFDDQDVASFHWVNDHRLVFDLQDTNTAVGDLHSAWGLYAVDTDATHMRILVSQYGRPFVSNGTDTPPLPWNTAFLSTIGDQRGNDVYVIKFDAFDDKEIKHSQLEVLDTLRGRARDLEAPQHANHWVFDRKGELRVVTTAEGDRERVLTRDVATDKWTQAADFPLYGLGGGFTPDYIDGDGKLYVTANEDFDTTAVWNFDLARNKLAAEPFLQSKRYDLNPEFIGADGKLVGLRYAVDAEVTQWLDPKYEALQAAVDKRLPSTVNQLSIASRGDGRFVVVHAYSDRLPGMWMLYEVATGKLSMLGNAQPDVDFKKMSTMEQVHYAARDGLDIPAYLTVPRGKPRKDLPLVVLVHGGPYVRGRVWDWDPEVQFLAARGYAVLEPAFRGTTGYGTKLYEGGLRQWGLAMQDDVADGVKWAVAQGIVDPKRVCIAGASYGGYAVLMGLIKDPDVYRCGVDWVGVTDINLMYTNDWSDASDSYKRYGMPVLIGDRVKDAAQLKATSPIENAAKIHAPVLLAYGGKDRRVPLEHGEKFREAMTRQSGAKVDWVVYDKEGHGWRNVDTRIDFWSRVAKFLDANIGATQ
jgi:acetyl esterase/lipase